MASGRGGCSARKLLLQPGTTTETHPVLMQDLDKRVLVQGRLGAEYGVRVFFFFALYYAKWKAYAVKSVLGRGIWKKKNYEQSSQWKDFCQKQMK